MSIRAETRFTEISSATRKHVFERDKGRCVLCGSYGALQCAHYIARSHGGAGREKNLVMLCPDCHRRYDQSGERRQIRAELRDYLSGLYDDWNENELIYRKGMYNA